MNTPDNATCNCCGEDITYDNIFTDDGLKELQITGICEVCFDQATFEFDDVNLDDLIRDYNTVIEAVMKFKGCVLAGGAMRHLVDSSDAIQDFDLFFTDSVDIERVKEHFLQNNYNCVFQCPAGELTTFKGEDGVKVQLITKRVYDSLEDCVDSFDITACCAGWDGENFYRHRRMVSDVLNNRIYLNEIEYPVATMKRIAKYVDKGYKLTAHASRMFVEQVSGMELNEDNMALYVD